MREQSHGDWVIWNDTREVERRTRTLSAIGAYGNAIFDLAGDAHSTPEALYGVCVNALLGVSPMLGRNILPRGELARPWGRDDSQPRLVDTPLSLGPVHSRPHRHRERDGMPGDRRDAARAYFIRIAPFTVGFYL